MSRFYFHIRNGNGFTRDEEGRELADRESAHHAAVKGARSLLSDEVVSGSMDLRGQIEVVDQAGAPVTIVKFGDVVDIIAGEHSPSETQGSEEK